MPTVLNSKGFRFYFYSNENEEPIHIHIEGKGGNGKIWLEPTIEVGYFHNFSSRDQREIMEIVDQYVNDFKDKWNEHFSE
jgi:hypothetical protein